MQQDNLTQGIVRILKPDGKTAGLGFVVTSEGLIMTCAHVVEYAKAGPGSTVRLVFITGQQTYTGRVDEKYWSASNTGDVAVLHLEVTLPDKVRPLLLGTSLGSTGHTFKTFGFPEVKPLEGMYGYGTIGDLTNGENGLPLLQLTNASEVTPGFSGAPVLDEHTHRVVGMVTSITPVDKYGRQAETTFITPSEFLREICPSLLIKNIKPYVGLEAFTKDKADFFFGRGVLVEELANQLKNNPRFLAVVGSSGSGKSSVVQAGLLPYLERVKLPGFNNICTVIYRYTPNPSDDLHSALQKAGAFNIEDTSSRIVIFIDQFEEIFARCPEPERSKFLVFLADLVEQKILQNKKNTLVIAVRADFYDPLLKSPLEKYLKVGQVNIQPLDKTELREAITKPAAHVGLEIDPGLDDRIIEDLKATQNPLPLLEFTLEQLWINGHYNGKLIRADYEKIGKVTGAIGQWGTEAYSRLEKEEKLVAKRIFTRLIHYGEGDIPDTRRRLLLSELLTTNDEELTRRVIKKLADERLLVTDRDIHSGEETIDIIHEALLREWSDLSIWTREQRTFLFWRQRLDERRSEWINKRKDEGLLLRGLSLVEAEGWLQQTTVDLNLDEQDFIKVSIALRQREKIKALRSTRITIGSITFVIVVIIASGLYFLWLQNQHLRDLLDARSGISSIDKDINNLNKDMKAADEARDKNELMKAFPYYSTIQHEAYQILQEYKKNPKRFRGINIEEIKLIASESEGKRVMMIRKHLLKELDERLHEKNNYGSYINGSIPANGEKQYTEGSALQETYKIIFTTGADLNGDNKIDTPEEANLIPCQTIVDIEKAWQDATGNRCGWLSCIKEIITESIRRFLFFSSSTSYPEERVEWALKTRCNPG